ncbi:retrotransposon protein, putative, ty1-copia subclass [Tanacetum coccineum]|uniref:Retrotransposon protein, putative, ty1-copia subclass n=1 Tax=Tanacetum coccineum TaxID=301880 RepID=A0ABQ5EIJ1_9ASTR
MAIQGGRIQKANKRSLNAKGNGKGKGKGKDKSYIPRPKNPKPSTKEHPTKDGACHHYKEAFSAASSKKRGIWVVMFALYGQGDIESCLTLADLGYTTKRWTISNKRAKYNLDSTFLWHCRLAHISKKRIEKLQHGGLLKSTDEESFDKCVSCLSEISGRAKELEEIQDEDTSPFENTSKIPMGVNGFEPPQEEVVPICRMDNSKRGYIPMQERLDLNKTQGASTPEEVKRMQNVPYASVNLGEPHWTAVKTIVKYLRNIKAMILVYGGNPEAKLKIDCYCNAGFETNRDDIKSPTRYVSVLN